jgi:aspartyl/glutamyl-tRNA(Asn/Gln) amidotransferase C subunit
MSDKISPELFSHLVELAALELTAEEAEYLRGELNKQLKAIDELAAMPIPAGTPPAAHGVPFPPAVKAPLRPDSSAQAPEAEAIKAGAPQSSEGYFVVPEIPHEDLE